MQFCVNLSMKYFPSEIMRQNISNSSIEKGTRKKQITCREYNREEDKPVD